MKIEQLATEALRVQNACNLSGLAIRFAEVVSELRACLPKAGTDEINQHPIVRLWVSKLHDLAGMGLSDWAAFADANKACELLVSMQVS